MFCVSCERNKAQKKGKEETSNNEKKRVQVNKATSDKVQRFLQEREDGKFLRFLQEIVR